MSDFLGPCAHGRDPYGRCDICGDLEPAEAERAAHLAAYLALPITRDQIRRGNEWIVELQARERKLEADLAEARLSRDDWAAMGRGAETKASALRAERDAFRVIAETLKARVEELERSLRAEGAFGRAAWEAKEIAERSETRQQYWASEVVRLLPPERLVAGRAGPPLRVLRTRFDSEQ